MEHDPSVMRVLPRYSVCTSVIINDIAAEQQYLFAVNYRTPAFSRGKDKFGI